LVSVTEPNEKFGRFTVDPLSSPAWLLVLPQTQSHEEDWSKFPDAILNALKHQRHLCLWQNRTKSSAASLWTHSHHQHDYWCYLRLKVMRESSCTKSWIHWSTKGIYACGRTERKVQPLHCGPSLTTSMTAGAASDSKSWGRLEQVPGRNHLECIEAPQASMPVAEPNEKFGRFIVDPVSPPAWLLVLPQTQSHEGDWSKFPDEILDVLKHRRHLCLW
jgi:hypothetical protein